METKHFYSDFCGLTGLSNESNSNSFLIHCRIGKGFNFFWIQLVGSQYEARNFEYSLKVEDLPDIGKFYYEGTVRSVDDDKKYIYKQAAETGLFGMVIEY